ncbi:MAG: hypothetical protein HY825_08320 [Acidobacteria bacterium]|nr:hypothetical protein [Acidobacteriota bacterium]
MAWRMLFAAFGLFLAFPAGAAITAAPAAVSVAPAARSSLVTLTLSYPTPPTAGTGTVTFSTSLAVVALPSWLSVIPVPPDGGPGAVTFTYAPPPAPPTSTATFRFATTAAAVPGTYTIYLGTTAGPPGVGTGTMTLTVLPPTFHPTISPNPATVQWGSTVIVRVATNPDPGLTGTINYWFGGFPAGITTGGTLSVSPPYPNANFTFSVAAGTNPGTYSGSMFAQLGAVTPAVFTMTVIVPQPNINVSFTQATMTVCNGGSPAANGIVLTPLLGYTGTPTVQFTGVPAGLTVTPLNPVASPMPPGQTVPFTVSASGLTAGPRTVTLSVTDAAAGVARTAFLTVNVADPDFTPAANPSPLSLTAGGPARTVTASLTPNACFASTVTVSPTGAPAGVTFTPSTATIAGPGWAPASLAVQAAPTTVAGTYPMMLTFTPATGPAKNVPFTLLVAALPDFTLAVNPPALTLQAGGGGTVAVTATALNGFTGPITVNAPAVPGVTFTPATFTLLPGGSQTVAVGTALSTPPGSSAVDFTSTAASVPGPRTATLNLTITPPPDFALAVTPASLTLQATTSATVTVSATARFGFSGPINVTAPAVAGVTFTPAGFTLMPGASQVVTLAAALAAPLGPAVAVFSGTAAGTIGTRTATLNLTITAPPNFALSILPPVLSVAQGHSGTVSVSVSPSGGFAGQVSVTGTSAPGVTLTPASFTLGPGAMQTVTVAVGINAPPTTALLGFSGTAPGIVGPRTASLALTITVPTPQIEAISPPAVATGTVSTRLRVVGRDFHSGAVASSPTPGLIVERITVISATLAEVLVSIPAQSRPGPYALLLTNPGGAPSNQGAVLLVYPAASLGAPLGVTAAAVVFPRPFTVISPKEPIFPRGLLATTGLGAIVGTWRFDGVPFDAFTVSAAGGLPVEVKANVPIPVSFAGEHTLELAIEQPQALVSEPVTVILAPESHTGLKIHAPAEGAIVGARAPTFRWSLLPGASGYEVEVDPANAPLPIRIRLSASQWRPSSEDLAGLGPGEHRFRVRAVFPGEVRSEPTGWRTFVVLPDRVALAVEPEPVEGSSGRRAVRWQGGAPGLLYRVELLAADRPTRLAEATTLESRYTIPSSLDGAVRVRLAAFAPDGSQRGEWREAVVASTHQSADGLADQEPPPPPPSPEETVAATTDEDGWLNWLVGAQVITVGNDEPDGADTAEANLQLSTQSDVNVGSGGVKATADVGWRRGFTPADGPLAQSRNWQAELGLRNGPVRPEGRAGYSPPDFLDQSEFLASGLARGGALGKVGTAAGTVSYYQTFNESSEASAGSLGPEQRLKAVAYEAPFDGTRFLLRAMAIRAEEETGPYTLGSRTEAIGLLGRFVLSPGLTLMLESARGEYQGNDEPGAEKREGWGLRLGASGAAGTFTYAVNLRQVDNDFINPLNPGFTPGGVPDRIGGDLSLSKLLGRASLSLQLRRQKSGGGSDSAFPSVVEDGAMVNLAVPLGQKVQLAASGTFGGTDGDADPVNSLPGTDRSQLGGMLSLTEMVGTASFTQALSWQETTDEVMPGADQTVTMATLGANGTLGGMLMLSAMLSGTRGEGSPLMGTTDQLVLSLQPSLNLSSLALVLTPRAGYTRMKNDVSRMDAASEQYQLVVQWSPAWASSLVSVQAGADLSRSLSGADMPAPPFQRRYTATVTLSWRADGVSAAAAAPPPSPPPMPSATGWRSDPTLLARGGRWL